MHEGHEALLKSENDMYTRLMVTLTGDETNALMHIAEEELRDPREQLRLFLRQEMERRGFLKSEQKTMAVQGTTGEQTKDDHDPS